MTRRPRLTEKDRQSLRLALQFAVSWERTFFDSMRHCTGPENEKVKKSTLQNIEDFETLYIKLK